MKVLRDGKEVKNAQIIYTVQGAVDTVLVDGVHYASEAFTFEEPKTVVKTKGSQEATKSTKKVAKKK